MAALPDEIRVPVRVVPADEVTARILGVPFTPANPRRWDYPVGGPGCPGCTAPREEEGEGRLAIRLPSLMQHEGASWRAKLGREWAEVFPGLQACLVFLGTDGGGTTATVHFRLTPSGEGDGDAARQG